MTYRKGDRVTWSADAHEHLDVDMRIIPLHAAYGLVWGQEIYNGEVVYNITWFTHDGQRLLGSAKRTHPRWLALSPLSLCRELTGDIGE